MSFAYRIKFEAFSDIDNILDNLHQISNIDNIFDNLTNKFFNI